MGRNKEQEMIQKKMCATQCGDIYTVPYMPTAHQSLHYSYLPFPAGKNKGQVQCTDTYTCHIAIFSSNSPHKTTPIILQQKYYSLQNLQTQCHVENLIQIIQRLWVFNKIVLVPKQIPQDNKLIIFLVKSNTNSV